MDTYNRPYCIYNRAKKVELNAMNAMNAKKRKMQNEEKFRAHHSIFNTESNTFIPTVYTDSWYTLYMCNTHCYMLVLRKYQVDTKRV